VGGEKKRISREKKKKKEISKKSRAPLRGGKKKNESAFPASQWGGEKAKKYRKGGSKTFFPFADRGKRQEENRPKLHGNP